MSRVHAKASTRPRKDKILHDRAALGFTVCRMWAFNNDTLGAVAATGAYQAC